MYQAINIHKVEILKGSLYLRIDSDALSLAFKKLNGVELKLFLYLANNRDNSQVNITRDLICEELNFTPDKYYRALRGLKSKGYIVEIGNGIYDFYEIAPCPFSRQKF